MDKKVIRSRDVVFLEDQTIDDFGKVGQDTANSNDLIDLDPIPSSTAHHEYVKDVQPPCRDDKNLEIPKDVEAENEGDEQIPEPPQQPVS